MTERGDRRRARMGQASVDAAHKDVDQAPAPSPALLEQLRVLLGTSTAIRRRRNAA